MKEEEAGRQIREDRVCVLFSETSWQLFWIFCVRLWRSCRRCLGRCMKGKNSCRRAYGSEARGPLGEDMEQKIIWKFQMSMRCCGEWTSCSKRVGHRARSASRSPLKSPMSLHLHSVYSQNFQTPKSQEVKVQANKKFARRATRPHNVVRTAYVEGVRGAHEAGQLSVHSRGPVEYMRILVRRAMRVVACAKIRAARA